jgi:hypothetical protein
MKELKSSTMPDYWDEISRNESELAFIIDMDA